MSWKFPKIVAAQRLQTLLLITALVAVVMGCLLMSDLVRTCRTAVIADADKSLANAVRELVDAERAWGDRQPPSVTPPLSQLDQGLRSVSYGVLVSYPDVRHILPDRISLEPTADPKTLEAVARFLERQQWLVTSVAVE